MSLLQMMVITGETNINRKLPRKNFDKNKKVFIQIQRSNHYDKIKVYMVQTLR